MQWELSVHQCQRQDDAFIYSMKAHWHKLKPCKFESQNCQGIGNPKNAFGGSEPHNFSSKTQRILSSAILCSLWPPYSRTFGQIWAKGFNAAIESVSIKSANGKHYAEELKRVKQSLFKVTWIMTDLGLGVFVDIIHQVLPEVKKVTSVHTICEAIKSLPYRTMLAVDQKFVSC